LITRFISKTNIKDAVIANQAESLKRVTDNASFYGMADA